MNLMKNKIENIFISPSLKIVSLVLLMRVKEESEKAGLKLYMQKTKIMASGPIILWQIDGEKVEAVTDLFTWSQKSLWMVTAALWKESYDKLGQHIKKQRHHFPDRELYSQKYGFSFSHVWM